MEKPCTGCGFTKPAEEFPLSKKGKLGRGPKCKKCTAEWRASHKEYFKEYNQTYYAQNSERIKNGVHEYAKKTGYAAQKKRDPHKAKARLAVMKALATGKMKKMPCFCCGEDAEAHHPDYDRPLDVVWLCGGHHQEIHNGIR